jgi:mono/diheme cytochrome c family protein
MKWKPTTFLATLTVCSLGLVLLPKSAAQGAAPTYYANVQAILEKHCVTCHVDGGIAPFALDSGKAAIDNAAQIARVIRQGSMPPWMPGDDSPAFLNDPRLSVETKQVVFDWEKVGAPLGTRLPNQKP